MRSDQRAVDQLRPLTLTKDYIAYPAGSVLIEMGGTKVICNASVEEKVPRFLKDQNRGWLTAEYNMLPGATHTRNERDIKNLKQNSRSIEIQRLIGRSLRAVVDFEALGERTVMIDCDVIQADGGTRTASITGGYVALRLAMEKLVAAGVLNQVPLTGYVAAISVGLVGDIPLLDLCYEEDKDAQVDFNVVMNDQGEFLEVQGTAEGKAFKRFELDALLDLAQKGISDLIKQQKAEV